MQRYLFQNLDTLIKYFLWRRRAERVAWNWCLEESKIDSSNVAICTQFANPRDFGMNIRHHRNILSDGSTGFFLKFSSWFLSLNSIFRSAEQKFFLLYFLSSFFFKMECFKDTEKVSISSILWKVIKSLMTKIWQKWRKASLN